MPSFAYFPFVAFPWSFLAASLCPRSFRLFSPFRASGSWPGPRMRCISRRDKIFDGHLDTRQIHFCIVRCPLLGFSLCEGDKISWNAVKNYLTYSCLCSFFFRTWPLRDEIMSSLANDIFLSKISYFLLSFLLTEIPSGREMRGNWKVRPVTRTIWNERNFEIFAKFALNFCSAAHTQHTDRRSIWDSLSNHCAKSDLGRLSMHSDKN